MGLGERKKKRKQCGDGDTMEMLKEALDFIQPTFLSPNSSHP